MSAGEGTRGWDGTTQPVAARGWVRWLRRPARARAIVATVGVLALSIVASGILVAYGSTSETGAVPLTDAGVAALTEAAASCPALTPARLAGQVMATTGFEPTAEGGIAGLTATEWDIWKPSDDVTPDDERAALLALAHLTCDPVGRLRASGFTGDLWPLAMAAFGSSLSDVRAAGGVPDAVAPFVASVMEYTDFYARTLGLAPESLPRPTYPVWSAGQSATATVGQAPSASPSPTAPSPTAPSTTPTLAPTSTTPAIAPPPPLALSFPSFASSSGLRLVGSARIEGGRLDLTTQVAQAGGAWATEQVDTSKSFTASFRAVIPMLTDGLAFVVQAEGADALGAGGGCLGYGGTTGEVRIRPSVAVEIDTWDNSWDGWDPAGHQHLAVNLDGDFTGHQVWADPGFDLVGAPFSVWVVYDAAAHQLSVYVSQTDTRPASPRLTYQTDLRAQLGVDRAWIGFTGGTGHTNLTNSRESVLAWSVSQSS